MRAKLTQLVFNEVDRDGSGNIADAEFGDLLRVSRRRARRAATACSVLVPIWMLCGRHCCAPVRAAVLRPGLARAPILTPGPAGP